MKSPDPTVETAVAVPHDLPAPPHRLLLVCACALAIGWAFIWWLVGRHELVLTGVTAAPTRLVTAPVEGRLSDCLFNERHVVPAGATLAFVEDSRLASQLAGQTQRVARLRDELAAAEARADVDLAWRQKELNGEIHQTRIAAADLLKLKLIRDVENLAWNEFGRRGDSQIDLASSDELLQSLNSSRFRSEEEQLRTALKKEAARNAAEVLDAQIELCDQRLSELRDLSERLPATVKQAAGLNKLRKKLKEAEEELTRLEMQPHRAPLSAPACGTVGLFHRAIGDEVKHGETIVEILDVDHPYLLVDVPSALLPQFPVNREVTLHFPGNIVRSGRVDAVPPQTNGRTDGDRISVRIEPTGELWPHTPVGTQVQVIVRKETL